MLLYRSCRRSCLIKNGTSYGLMLSLLLNICSQLTIGTILEVFCFSQRVQALAFRRDSSVRQSSRLKPCVSVVRFRLAPLIYHIVKRVYWHTLVREDNQPQHRGQILECRWCKSSQVQKDGSVINYIIKYLKTFQNNSK